MNKPVRLTLGQTHQSSAKHSEHDPNHTPPILTLWNNKNMYRSTVSPAEVYAFEPGHRKRLATRKDAPIHIYEDAEENEEGSTIYDNDHQQFILSSNQRSRSDNDHRLGAFPEQFLTGREMRTSAQQARRQRHQDKDRLPWLDRNIREVSHKLETSTRSTHETVLLSNETLIPLSTSRKTTTEGMGSLSQGMIQEPSVACSKRIPLQKSLTVSSQENRIVGNRPGRKTGKENIPPGQPRISEKGLGCGEKKGVSWRVESDNHGRKQSRTPADSLTNRRKIDTFSETVISHPYRGGQVKASQVVCVTRARLNERPFSSSNDHVSSRERSKAEQSDTSNAKTGPVNSNKAKKSVLAPSSFPPTSVLEANLGFQAAEKNGTTSKEANTKEMIKQGSKPVYPRKYNCQMNDYIQQDMKNLLQSVHVSFNNQRLGDALIHALLSQPIHRFQLSLDLHLRQAFLKSYTRMYTSDPSKTARLNIASRDTQVPVDKSTMHNALMWEIQPLNLRIRDSISPLGNEDISQTENNDSKGNIEHSKETERSQSSQS